ncbi:MAG: hypothetical protein AAF502_24080 [Bacteroidota bacterium]
MIHPLRALAYLFGALALVAVLYAILIFRTPLQAEPGIEVEVPPPTDLAPDPDPEPAIYKYIPPPVDLVDHQKRYDSLIAVISAKRVAWASLYRNAESETGKKDVIKDAGSFLHTSLSAAVFPAWYGTEWDFNGYTNNPRDGLVACGYFVSTPLKHIGLKLNRYTLAQQAASNIIKSLCPAEDYITIGNNDFDRMLSYVESRPDNLYVIGLDNHVGFIERRNGKTNFIHSSYIDASCGCVLSEDARKSPVLPYSNIYVIGHISDNEMLIKKWLFSEHVTIVKS